MGWLKLSPSSLCWVEADLAKITLLSLGLGGVGACPAVAQPEKSNHLFQSDEALLWSGSAGFAPKEYLNVRFSVWKSWDKTLE